MSFGHFLNLARMDRLNRRSIWIRRPHLADDGKVVTVTADVAGEPIWFQAEGVRLRPDPVAYLIAYHFSARRLNRRLRIDQAVAPNRMPRLADVTRLTNDWWGLGPAPAIHFGRRKAVHPNQGHRTGLLLSCGMDSLEALLDHRAEIDDLILIHGFDIPIEDGTRFAALEAEARAAANAVGKRLIVVRTNLRTHRLFRKTSWKHNHGAALAAVGHVLGDELKRLLVSASYPSEALVPWGSHPLLDHLWSSAALKIEHVGDALWRFDKVRKYGAHPLVQQHLSVCWEGKGRPVNCGVCEKCVRNQIAFKICGHPIPKSFPTGVDLVRSLREIPKLSGLSNVYHYGMQSDRLSSEVRAEIVALMERSQFEDTHGVEGSDAWDEHTVASRIEDEASRKRYAGGSPNEEEIAAYERYLPSPETGREGTAVVLGMTPELRELAARHFEQVVSVDRGKAAIERYRAWLPPELSSREKIFAVDWQHLPYIDWSVLPPVRAIVGDGVFGNFPTATAQADFLGTLRSKFPGATLVFRMALAKPIAKTDDEAMNRLRAAFRSGQIDTDAFGFCMRLQGFLNTHYSAETGILDNAALFQDCDRLAREGFFNTEESAAINRFRFKGPNCLLTEVGWERLLGEGHFAFEKTELAGKPWYGFYPIYALRTDG